jgi:hypothetical protein
MTPAQRQKRYRLRLKRKARQSRAIPPGHFRNYQDFVPALNAARHAVAAEYGERWDLYPACHVWARLPRAWVRVLVTDGKSRRWSTGPRDRKLPTARFWPGGRLPVGAEYAQPTPQPLPRIDDIVDVVLGQEVRRRLDHGDYSPYRATGRSPHQKGRAA